MPPPGSAATVSGRALTFGGEVGFTVDGPGGSTSGVVRGDGSVLRVRADDPAAVWEAVVGSAPGGSGALRVLADRMHDDDVAVEVSGPGGVLATVGQGADSLLGRLVTGSRRVQPGRPSALRPLLGASLRRAVRTSRGALLLAAVAVAVLVAGRRPRPH